MPNTPALIGEGMTGVCYDKKLFEETEKQMISNFFESFGMMEIVPEYMMNAVVCISSSAPAYIYMFIEALADTCHTLADQRRRVRHRTHDTAVTAQLLVDTVNRDTRCNRNNNIFFRYMILDICQYIVIKLRFYS